LISKVFNIIEEVYKNIKTLLGIYGMGIYGMGIYGMGIYGTPMN